MGQTSTEVSLDSIDGCLNEIKTAIVGIEAALDNIAERIETSNGRSRELMAAILTHAYIVDPGDWTGSQITKTFNDFLSGGA